MASIGRSRSLMPRAIKRCNQPRPTSENVGTMLWNVSR